MNNKNGYTSLDFNKILEGLARMPLNTNEWRLLMVIVRKTFGWKKQGDKISVSQFQNLTGLLRGAVCRSLKSLEIKKVIVAERFGKCKTVAYKLQDNTAFWERLTVLTDEDSSIHADEDSSILNPGGQLSSAHAEQLSSPASTTKEEGILQREEEVFDLNLEIKKLKNIGLTRDKIRFHLINIHQVEEEPLDKALGSF